MSKFGLRLVLAFGLLVTFPLMAQDLTQPYVEGQVFVRFQPGLAAADRAAVRGALLPTASQPIALVPGLELVRTPLGVDQAIAVLGNNPNVAYVEPDYLMLPEEMPDDYYTVLLWGLNNTGQDIRGVLGVPDADIDMPEAWAELPALLPGGAEVVVAVIDSGTQLDHEDLAGSIWVNEAESNGVAGYDDDGNGYIDDVNGWDFLDNDNDPSDETGHGTHTAGTIAARTDNGIGVPSVCFNLCKIMPLRFLGAQGGPTSAAVAALAYAVDKGVRVSNNSWGGGGFSQSLYDAIAAAEAAGHVFVTSAGNDGVNTDFAAHYPSSYDNDNIISVAATDNLDLRAWFSNYGADSVDLGAPGFDVASLYFRNQYYWMSGTSMATPHVTGVVALLLAIDPAQTALGIKHRVLSTVRPLPALSGMTVTGGMLNAYGAITDAATAPNPGPPARPEAFTGTDMGNGTASLSWTPVATADNYLLERQKWQAKNRNTGSWTAMTSFTAEAPPYDDSSGTGRFRYRIAAANDAGTSGFTGWVEVRVTDAGSGDGGSAPNQCRPKKSC